jgi:NAD(P)-dependent dehydrogenase (short-subunit alcohol dehydrogenase family)
MSASTARNVSAPSVPAAQSFAGRVALITGGGSGIGRAAAIAYASRGARVVVAGRRQAELEETVELIVAQGGEALSVPSDVSLAAEVRALVGATVHHFGRIDMAFNNAGIEGQFAPIVELDENDFDHLIAVNLKGVWLSIKYEITAMLRSGEGGAIVNTSSFLARAATPGSSAYSASKGALESMIRPIALEVGPQGVRINNVLPGAIDTPMFARLGGAAAATSLSGFTPLRRVGMPTDVADVAVWLCSDDARFITGQSLLVDGGFTIPGMR